MYTHMHVLTGLTFAFPVRAHSGMRGEKVRRRESEADKGDESCGGRKKKRGGNEGINCS